MSPLFLWVQSTSLTAQTSAGQIKMKLSILFLLPGPDFTELMERNGDELWIPRKGARDGYVLKKRNILFVGEMKSG